jgi:hypothetical protein
MKHKTGGEIRNAKLTKVRKAVSREGNEVAATVRSLLPAGSKERVAVGVAAAAGGALLVSATLGVGATALAGAAGYAAYRGLRNGGKKGRNASVPHES